MTAPFLVTAVNAHAGLLAAAKEDLAVFDSFEIDGAHCRELPDSAIARLRAAIAAAEESAS